MLNLVEKVSQLDLDVIMLLGISPKLELAGQVNNFMRKLKINDYVRKQMSPGEQISYDKLLHNLSKIYYTSSGLTDRSISKHLTLSDLSQ